MQCPLISCTQKIVIYETKARYFIVGSNNTETKFRVLKIDRMEPRDLNVIDDKVEYSRKEIRELLMRIDVGNRPRLQKGPVGLKRTVSAFGIVGFVRFLEGYYMVLITKRRRVSLIGPHTIYKIEDTALVYIPNDLVRYVHPEEQRYVKMFQNVDLSSNFYFSYSYDLTHTLQYNLTPCKLRTDGGGGGAASDESQQTSSKLEFWQTDGTNDEFIHNSVRADRDVEDAFSAIQNPLESDESSSVGNNRKPIANNGTLNGTDGSDCSRQTEEEEEGQTKVPVYGVRTAPQWKYVWNENMLKKVYDEIQMDWILIIVHGFIGQSNINVFGRPVYLTLIARRSNQFAGTRFLKRGANTKGSVANEVETEQIVHDASMISFDRIRFTSFVQLRGSIPLHWSQDINKMVPKPPITLDQSDPYGYIVGQHLNQVLHRYGAPIIILDLVKKREKKRHESIISEELVNVIQYLNQFLPIEHYIKYIGFDMARVNKTKNSNVLLRLAEIAEFCVKKTSFFQSHHAHFCRELRPNAKCRGLLATGCDQAKRQCGVVRTNCVDCLDRTNTAQFVIGKCALAMQLHALGIIDVPVLNFDSDCVRMMEDLYEDQGDTLALQYGGSQLVHRIKSYRKVAPRTSSARDIMQTLSRYYSNAFSDSDKQQAINLFLGVFEPEEGSSNIWELTTDFYLHNDLTLKGPRTRLRRYTQWWELPVVRSLPLPYEEESKGFEGRIVFLKTSANDERIDAFWEYYKPYELTTLDEQYSFNMPNSIRDFMPKFATNHSPFTPRVGRRQEQYGNLVHEVNPNMSGKDSTSSTTSNGSEGSTSGSENSDIEGDFDENDGDVAVSDGGVSTKPKMLKDMFETMVQTYGIEINEPSLTSNALYKRYALIGDIATKPLASHEDAKMLPKATTTNLLLSAESVSLDLVRTVRTPRVSNRSTGIYEQYCKRGRVGASSPTDHDLQIYQQYALNSCV